MYKSKIGRNKQIAFLCDEQDINKAKRIASFVYRNTLIRCDLFFIKWDKESIDLFKANKDSIAAVIYIYSSATVSNTSLSNFLTELKETKIKLLFGVANHENLPRLHKLGIYSEDIYGLYNEDFFNYTFVRHVLHICEGSYLKEQLRKKNPDIEIDKEFISDLSNFEIYLKEFIECYKNGGDPEIIREWWKVLDITVDLLKNKLDRYEDIDIFRSIVTSYGFAKQFCDIHALQKDKKGKDNSLSLLEATYRLVRMVI